MKRIAVIGGGSWGTALAIVAARAGQNVTLWSRNSNVVETVNRDHANPSYLSDVRIPEAVSATKELAAAVSQADLIVLAVPSHAVRQTLSTLANVDLSRTIVASAT